MQKPKESFTPPEGKPFPPNSVRIIVSTLPDHTECRDISHIDDPDAAKRILGLFETLEMPFELDLSTANERQKTNWEMAEVHLEARKQINMQFQN